jgi:hypothetical protein
MRCRPTELDPMTDSPTPVEADHRFGLIGK